MSESQSSEISRSSSDPKSDEAKVDNLAINETPVCCSQLSADFATSCCLQSSNSQHQDDDGAKINQAAVGVATSNQPDEATPSCSSKQDEASCTPSTSTQADIKAESSNKDEASTPSTSTMKTDDVKEEAEEGERAVVVKAKPVRKVFKSVRVNKIPAEILNNELLNEAIEKLFPKNYNLEIHKTIWRIKELNAKRVGLQMPEGLLMFSMELCDVIEAFTEADTVIMGEVTYGACCVDDVTAGALGVDLLVHYGHSCLIPIDRMDPDVRLLYVFVDIKIDTVHCIETIKHNIPVTTRIGMVSTIQFVSTLHVVAAELRNCGYNITVPQSKPLSPGEIIGCTAPRIKDVDILIYLGDGRFHLEAAMISNPSLKAYRYDPYSKKFTTEGYDHEQMLKNRKEAIMKAKDAKCFGLIRGTLGRQGDPRIITVFEERIKALGREYVNILAKEIMADRLALFEDTIDAFIQVACPRLSIDWGTQFHKPLLTPYEGAVALKMAEFDDSKPYPMDYYANLSLGPWTPNYKPSELEKLKEKEACCGKCKDVNYEGACEKSK